MWQVRGVKDGLGRARHERRGEISICESARSGLVELLKRTLLLQLTPTTRAGPATKSKPTLSSGDVGWEGEE